MKNRDLVLKMAKGMLTRSGATRVSSAQVGQRIGMTSCLCTYHMDRLANEGHFTKRPHVEYGKHFYELPKKEA